jgi:hypothetical protein
MDLKVAGTIWKIQIADLEEWREKAYHKAIHGKTQKVAHQVNQDQAIQVGR